MKKILLISILAFVSFFKTGCGPDEANAVNIMLPQTHSFKVIDNIQVTNIKPAEGASGIPTNAVIECDVAHPEFPVLSVDMVVEANGVPVAGDLEFTNGHVKWTPAKNYPPLADIVWTVTGHIENGQ